MLVSVFRGYPSRKSANALLGEEAIIGIDAARINRLREVVAVSSRHYPKLNAVGSGRVIETVLPLIGLITPGARAGDRLAAMLAKLSKAGYAHLRNPPAGGISHKPVMPSSRTTLVLPARP